MTPQSRERALAGLPASQQKQIADRIEKLGSLDPSNRQQLLDRYRHFEDLNSRQQENLRRNLRHFQGLPQPRKAAVRNELNGLEKLSPSDRNRRMISDDFRSRFNPNERQILEKTSSALLGKL